MALPVLGTAVGASATPTKATRAAKAAKGSAAWCAKHAERARCAGAGGATGTGGTGGAPSSIVVTATPNPLVETGQSEVHAVIEVSTSPSLAGDTVLIDSSQLDSSCSGAIPGQAANLGPRTGVTFWSISAPGGTPSQPAGSAHQIEVILDDDGNATVIVNGTDCAPGSDVISADLIAAPYSTALTTLVVNPPVVTAAGVTAFPGTEVETGDTPASGESDIYAVFYVETSPVYAEQPVEIASTQLQARCGDGWLWSPGNAPASAPFYSTSSSTAPGTAETTLDDDGNAVFEFYGASCAAGTSEVIADVLAGTHPTYATSFIVNPPSAGSSTPPVP
ncbi:MAG: hypothetical protein ACRDY1_08895 [Acidimicrobiales bacterium]